MATKKVIVDSFATANIFFRYASDLGKSSLSKEKLASALIFACLAEFYCEEFIKTLISYIEDKNLNRKVKFISKTLNNNTNTNLESALKKLRVLDYPDKKKIEDAIEVIKDARNKVFHNLVRAAEKNIRTDVQISIIVDHVPYLNGLIVKSLLEIADPN
jgi:hypothetical protein